MKKWIVLMVVMLLATSASAGMVWSVSGNSGPGAYDVLAGDVLVLTLGLDSGVSTGLSLGAVTDNGAGGTMTDSLVNAAFTTGHEDGLTKAQWEAMAGPSAYDNGAAIYISGATTGTGISSALLTLYYTVSDSALDGDMISITGSANGMTGQNYNVTISNVATPLAGLELNVIPEPMTIALLGLGGLFLRRKK